MKTHRSGDLTKSLLTILALFTFLTTYSQTNTNSSGSWSTASNWSAGVPTGGSTANVNNAMTLNANISITGGGYYTFNQPVTDAAGGTAYTLSVSGSGTDGVLDVKANTVFEGTASINGSGKLIVRAGTTLTLGATTFANNSIVVVEAGATLIINGNLANNNNSNNITIDGNLQVNGNFTGGNGSAIIGSGTFSTTGSMTTSGSGTVFGSSVSCSTGPCSGNTVCGNSISTAPFTVCSGSTINLSATTLATYQWQSSSTLSGPWSNLTGATSQNYSGTVTSTTYFRRYATNGTGCNTYSNPVLITVNPLPTVSASGTATICSGSSTNLSATASGGSGGGYTYTWSPATNLSSSTISNPVASPTTSTSYTVTVKDGNNCTSASSSAVTVTVNPKPTVTVPANSTICNGASVSAVTFTSTPAGATFTWTNNQTSIGLAASGSTSVPSFTAANAGASPVIATITVTATLNSCQSTPTAYTITVNPTPSAPTVTTPVTYCQDAAATALTATGTSLLWYTVSTGGTGSATSPTPSTTSAGTTPYYVSQTVSSCESARSTINVVVNAKPATPTISASGSTSLCAGCGLTLTSSAVSGNTWSSGQTTQAISVTTAGSYTVTVTNVNGCSATSAATVVTVSTNCSYTWNGSSSTDWSDANNWGQCIVPASTNDVVIPSGVSNNPTITGTANARNITIDPSATLILDVSGTLNVYGNLANSGTYTANGTTVFTGSASQSVNGLTTCNNLTINNGAGVVLNTATTVNGILTLNAGALNSSGKLTVNLNTGGISGAGTGSITGQITVFKSPTSTKYHMLGNPLTGSTISFSQFSDDIYVGNGSVYQYDETNVSINYQDGWVYPNLAGSLTNLKGYAFYFWSAGTIDITGTYNHTNTTYTTSVTNTASGAPDADGWNLIANPYPSTIDWAAASGWTKSSNIDDAIYIWDGAAEAYASYVAGIGTNGGTSLIPSMQAFWVRCNAPGTGSVGMDNGVRSNTPAAMWKLSNSNIMKLAISSGKYTDQTVIRLASDATNGFDKSFDAYKLDNSGKTPNFYSQLDNIPYSINSLSDTASAILIPLVVRPGLDGVYDLAVSNLESLDSDYEVSLIDSLLHITQDLKTSSTYSFDANAGDTLNRFYINLRKQSTTDVTGIASSKASTVRIVSNGDYLNVDFGANSNGVASIQLTNIMGNEVYRNDHVSTSNPFVLELENAPAGIYLVKVVMNSNLYSGKVYLK